MFNNYRNFFNILSNPIEESKSNYLLGELLALFLKSIEGNFDLDYKNISNIEELISAGEKKGDHLYFWKWLRENSLDVISKIPNKKLNDDNDTLDILEYRLYILNEEFENGNIDALIVSLTEVISDLNVVYAESFEFYMNESSTLKFSMVSDIRTFMR